MIKANLKDHPVKEVMAVSTMQNKLAGFVCKQPDFPESQEVQILLLPVFKWEMSSGGISRVMCERKRRNSQKTFFPGTLWIKGSFCLNSKFYFPEGD